MNRGTGGEHEQTPAEGEPTTQNPTAGTDDDTSYDEGTGDQIRPDAEEGSTTEQGRDRATHHLPADIPPGEIPER
ncbi:hypothetical protein [Saccharopolyspora mangrovi]|uniref:Uncharacterized protein n=1 Tax=Saccharopolyspora mangrovi TaxID=3082379 RepID=A0ABU6AE07_9PSEU|nr:hypothetical protein [Saccharopolyspora sp. S2-29]MEB3369789.1 hypothetical protein [Saccharopolyspora sp. S2-29]